jgi:hypothetical protein
LVVLASLIKVALDVLRKPKDASEEDQIKADLVEKKRIMMKRLKTTKVVLAESQEIKDGLEERRRAAQNRDVSVEIPWIKDDLEGTMFISVLELM